MQCQDNTNTYAGFGVRLAAYLVDSLIVSCVTGFVSLIAWFMSLILTDQILSQKIIFDFSIVAIINVLIKVIYFILCTYSTGQTIGKHIFNIKVVDDNGNKATLWNITYRESIGRYLSSILYIGYIIIAASSEKKALHDMLCDTRVVYAFKEKQEVTVIKDSVVKDGSQDNSWYL